MAALLREMVSSIESGGVPRIEGGNRDFLCQFFYNSISRSPKFWERIDIDGDVSRTVRGVIASVEKEVGPMSEVRREALLGPKSIRYVADSARVTNLVRQPKHLIDEIKKKDLVWGWAPDGSQFIVGNAPVARFEKTGVNSCVIDRAIELWMPVAPRIVLGFVDLRESFVPRFNLSRSDVRRINVRLRRSSDCYGGSNAQLISSLIAPR
jgi:hypothetical protein